MSRRIDVKELSFQLKKQRDFLRWMARRYREENPDQSEAFLTGAGLFDKIREQLKAGDYDGEVFTSSEEELEIPAVLERAELVITQEELDRLDGKIK